MGATATHPHLVTVRIDSLPAPALPNIPTVDETLKGFESDNWYSMFFPAGTPRDIVMRFHTDMTKVLKDPDVRALMDKRGAVPLGSTP